VIRSFFATVAPPHGHETGQVGPPDEDAGEHPIADVANHLEAFLAINFTDGRDDHVVGVVENPVAEGQRKSVLPLVGRVFLWIEPVLHEKKYTEIPYYRQCEMREASRKKAGGPGGAPAGFVMLPAVAYSAAAVACWPVLGQRFWRTWLS
jgi:hypothetical protein